MPNWCENELIIEGEPQTLDFIQSVSAHGDLPFSMEAFKPTPPLLLEKSGISADGNAIGNAFLGNTNYEYDNWYEWRIAHWGTKWDIADLHLHRTERAISLSYQTAWSPNVSFWTYFSSLYPSVKISHRFVEEGMDYIGQAFYQDGEIDELSRNLTDDDFVKAGAIFFEDGKSIDWDNSNLNLWNLFPLSAVTTTKEN